jgi:isopenicillin-N N-acyltransferase-like protein
METGRALGREIRRSLVFSREFLARRGVGEGDLAGLLGPYREAATATFPEFVEEIEAMAAGAGVGFWELFAANAWEELEPTLAPASGSRAPDRCTAFAVRAADGGTILAHNEQWYAGDAGSVAVVAARPDVGPPFLSPTVATYLPAVGMNTAGVAQAVMSLTARDDGVGVPRVLVSRHALQAESVDDGVRRATAAGRAGGYAHLFAQAGGAAVTAETTATDHRELDGPGGHTNHYLHPDLAPGDANYASGSRERLERLTQLLEERRPATPQDAAGILRDHQSDSQSICLHPRPEYGDEASGVLFAMVCHLESGRMWVAGGNPCSAPFQEIDVSTSLALGARP